MSDDPLDPDDWQDGDDEEGLPEDTPDDTDPFADVAADRTGDPFEELGAPPGGPSAGSADEDHEDHEDHEDYEDHEDHEGGSRGTQSWDDQSGDDQSWDGVTTDDASAGLETGDGTEDPFAGPDPRGDPFEEEGVFEQQEVGAVDPDEVWEDLAGSDRVESDDGSHYAEVSKHTYCENCEWFSEPPAVSCTHEGTEIVEFLDMETARLLNCPVVEERRAIRDED